MQVWSGFVDRPVRLKIISNEVGTVQVMIPTLEMNTTYTLTPKVTDISINSSDLRADVIGIDNKGIQIISTVEVAIYVIEGDQGYSKVMPLMPVISSAKLFVVQSYETDSLSAFKCQFIIIATKNTTDVTIKLKIASPGNVTYNNISFKDGDIMKITLNWLQSFYVFIFANDLSGTLIESNKPIAVYSGTDCVYIPRDLPGGCNIIESQMVPVSQWGDEYIIPTVYPGRSHVRVFAFYDATHISVIVKNDLGSNITLNQGEFWETTLYGSQAQPLLISGDKVISVVLYGASIGVSDGHKSNPFMLLVPDINQYSTTAKLFPTLLYGIYIPKEYPVENYAAIVLFDTSFDLLQYNGKAPEILQSYNILNEYTVVIIALKNETMHTISTVNTSTPIPMAVFVYGMARFESYGFVAEFKFINAGNFS